MLIKGPVFTGPFLCPWMGGMSQRARDGGETNAHGWAVCLKEPGTAVRRMPMDGRYVSRNQGRR